MKNLNVLKKIFENKVLRIVSLVIIVVIILGIIMLCTYNKEEKLDTTYILAKLQKSSELTTAKLNFTGWSQFEDSGVPFINKANFDIEKITASILKSQNDLDNNKIYLGI